MKIIKPYYTIENLIDGIEIIQFIEKCGRTSYKSEDKITEQSAENFIKMLIKNGHLSVLEHYSFSVRIICDRGISHEIVRHRIASYTQESTRYCNYSKDKFGNEITVIEPPFNSKYEYDTWKESCEFAEKKYFELLKYGVKPQIARSILPTCLKTEIVVTMNLREWRHFFHERTSLAAHPQMREITIPLLEELKYRVPLIFDDIEVK